MGESPERKKCRFWPVLGVVLAADLGLALLYTVLIPGLTGRTLSDSLCTSAMLLGVVCAAPVLLDAFRGFSVAAHMDGTKEERRETLAQEQKRREQGMVVTFALATATLLITLLSLLIGLL